MAPNRVNYYPVFQQYNHLEIGGKGGGRVFFYKPVDTKIHFLCLGLIVWIGVPLNRLIKKEEKSTLFCLLHFIFVYYIYKTSYVILLKYLERVERIRIKRINNSFLEVISYNTTNWINYSPFLLNSMGSLLPKQIEKWKDLDHILFLGIFPVLSCWPFSFFLSFSSFPFLSIQEGSKFKIRSVENLTVSPVINNNICIPLVLLYYQSELQYYLLLIYL